MGLYDMSNLKKRILELSFRHKLGHVGSCLSAVDIIDYIYNIKSPNDIFILSPGHMGLAWYVVLEKHNGTDAEMLLEKHGGHPNRDIENEITCSSGSLGLAFSVAVGMAIADKTKKVHCLISDGECAEGIVWESLRFINDKPIDNIHVYVLINGLSATLELDKELLVKRINAFAPNHTTCIYANSDIPEVATGLEAHYHIIKDEEYEKIL